MPCIAELCLKVTGFKEKMNLDNVTQLMGVLSFSTTALVCFRTWRNVCGVWGWLSGVYLLLVVDVVLGWRHILSEVLRNVLRGSTFYETRTGLPAIAISICLLCLLLFICWHMVRRIANRSTLLAVLSSVFILFLFTLEVVSLHAVDAVLYHAYGPAYAVGWAWLAGSAFTAVAAYSAMGSVK